MFDFQQICQSNFWKWVHGTILRQAAYSIPEDVTSLCQNIGIEDVYQGTPPSPNPGRYTICRFPTGVGVYIQGSETIGHLIDQMRIEGQTTNDVFAGKFSPSMMANFAGIYTDIKTRVLNANKKQVVFVGHSYGGCLAFLCNTLFARETGKKSCAISFGAPAFCNAAGSESIENNALRIVNYLDVIPRIMNERIHRAFNFVLGSTMVLALATGGIWNSYQHTSLEHSLFRGWVEERSLPAGGTDPLSVARIQHSMKRMLGTLGSTLRPRQDGFDFFFTRAAALDASETFGEGVVGSWAKNLIGVLMQLA